MYCAICHFSDAELLNFATEMEGHPDNVAASLYGGIVVSAQENGQVHTVQLACPSELSIVLAIPDFPLSTKQAREVLPKSVDFRRCNLQYESQYLTNCQHRHKAI